jgi:hypothetical protein
MSIADYRGSGQRLLRCEISTPPGSPLVLRWVESPRAGLRESAAALRKRRWNSLDPRFHLALSDDRIEMSGQSPGEQTASPIGRLSWPPQEEESCDV